MKVADFDYHLPPDLIAQYPSAKRDKARLMVLHRRSGEIDHRRFCELPRILGTRTMLVLNDTRVFPARLFAQRPNTDEEIEVLLVRQRVETVWEALVRPGRKARLGSKLVFGAGELDARVIGSEGRIRILRFSSGRPFTDLIEELGEVPLPPYIFRPEGPSAQDQDRYQTVYARTPGSIAAPTAGLHFTPRLLREIPHCCLTLHVGYGTFKPVSVSRVEQHRVDVEHYQICEASVAKIEAAREAGDRVVAVGTTTTRALESVAEREGGKLVASAGRTDLFIYPGFRFQVVEGLVTNFHLPRSSLLMMVSAFAGRELILKAYRTAVEERYRFYSYGDAMLIL